MNDPYTDYSKYYPAQKELEAWIEDIHNAAAAADFKAEIDPTPYIKDDFGQFHAPAHLVKFTRDGHVFWGNCQFKQTGSPSPLLVQLCGYGAELSCDYDIAALGYNLLQLSPLGYWTPDGYDNSLRRHDYWPVLEDTVLTGAKGGYREWLIDAVCAANWARRQTRVIGDHISFYGGSQGGGTAILLGSLYKDRGTACVAADEPFLTNFPLANFRGAYGLASNGMKTVTDEAAAWNALGYIDTCNHASRLSFPVLLTAGGMDTTCPPETVRSLYDRLSCTKSLTFMPEHGHATGQLFIKLAMAWFSLYA